MITMAPQQTPNGEKIHDILLTAERHIRKLGARRNAPALKRVYRKAAAELHRYAMSRAPRKSRES